MKVAGFTFIRNAIRNDYPIVEAICSILPICDEFVVAAGDSDDATLALIENIGSDKIKIVKTQWDESLRDGGAVFAAETGKAYKAISPDADWAFYIQGDECIHEKYLPVIKKEMEETLADDSIEGLLFHYLHFYGSYDYTAQSRRWYRREIRLVKNLPGIHAYRDAQGFRLANRKISVKLIDAYVYHYGWVKPPKGLEGKIRNFNAFYHSEEWIQENLPETYAFNYHNADRLVPFTGTHPAVMASRVAAMNWKLDVDLRKVEKQMDLRRKILQKIEDWTGYRVSEYRNYKRVK